MARPRKYATNAERQAAYRKRKKRSVHFRSDSFEWSTPQDLFDELHREFAFDLDVCATVENAKCERFYSRRDDGLKQPWFGTCWCNPPYGRDIGRWVEKSLQASRDGAVVVCLLPSRTDTRWWHECVSQAEDVRFLRGRLRFGGHENSAPFPSVVAVFRMQSRP
ncbi:MAG: hypothetical protein IT203_09495 [Fimbriimonadaceae bacterium]|nr:hypothetical protein [Fimbriimonadaceae bacterium]